MTRHAPSERIRGRARLHELIGLALALDDRNGRDERDRRRLDREIGARITSEHGLGLLRSWLAQAPAESLKARMSRVRASLIGLGGLLAAAGLFLGWAAASALLSIEVHEGRINIVLAVVLLVLIPLVTLLVSLIGWLSSLRSPDSANSRSLGEVIRGATLGRLVLGLMAPRVRQDVEVVLGRLTTHKRLYARVERGQLMRWSQTLGLGFGIGALVATFAFVVFTDLAFGWSTTLDIAAEDVHRWVRIMAAPWAALWPAASPSQELVESTRFFRVNVDKQIHVVDPILYGGWWPFLVMAISCYCVLPRALAAIVISEWHHREIGRAMGLTPGVERLVDRLTNPIVEGQALEEERDVGRAGTEILREVDREEWIAQHSTEELVVIRWADLIDDERVGAAIGTSKFRVLDAGGRQSLEDDVEVARAVAATDASVAFLVRGYEPPVLDVLDFLTLVRSKAGEERALCVFLSGAKESDLRTWQRKLATLGDPRLVVSRLRPSDV
jgi:hypothetical protein